MENEIQKPMSVARAEFITELSDLIRKSTLPPFVIEPIISDLLNDIRILSQKQLEADIKNYHAQLAKSKKDNPSDN